jgi:hypothetical protein
LLVVEHCCSLTVEHCLSLTVEHACLFTVEHCCLLTVLHCLSWTVLHLRSWTVLHCCSLSVVHCCLFTVEHCWSFSVRQTWLHSGSLKHWPVLLGDRTNWQFLSGNAKGWGTPAAICTRSKAQPTTATRSILALIICQLLAWRRTFMINSSYCFAICWVPEGENMNSPFVTLGLFINILNSAISTSVLVGIKGQSTII